MTPRDLFLYLILEFREKNYTTKDFADLFLGYRKGLELEGVSDAGSIWMEEMEELCARFLELPEDREYEKKLIQKAEEFSLRLLLPDPQEDPEEFAI